MEDDEGGPVMVASSCESDTESGPAFRLLCGGEINIRYDGLGMAANPPASSTLVLTSGGKSLIASFKHLSRYFNSFMSSKVTSLSESPKKFLKF